MGVSNAFFVSFFNHKLSGQIRLNAESELAGKSAPRQYIFVITVAKRQAKAGTAE
jgi:hypothetical protein